MALATVLGLTTMILLTFATLANLSIAALRFTSGGRDKAIALSLAEAGIDQAVEAIGDAALKGTNYKGTNGPVALDGGTFSVKVTDVSENLKDVYSDGLPTNGKSRRVRARVNLSGLSVGNGAMISNGNVEVYGSVVVQAVDKNNSVLPEARIADVRANGQITGNGSAVVDGRVAAAGSVNIGSVTATAGTKSGAPRIAFPTPTKINAWTEQWVGDAKKTGNVVASGLSLKNGDTTTITGPACINGEIKMTGGTLTFAGDGPIYVNGNVTMSGNSRLVNGSNLVVAGTFKQTGNTLDSTPAYEAAPSPTQAPPGLIVLSDDQNSAVMLTGGATNNQYSLIYAVNGGISVEGNTKVNGSLVAGGKNAKLTSQGNYTHSYPKDSVNLSRFAVAPEVQSWIEM